MKKVYIPVFYALFIFCLISCQQKPDSSTDSSSRQSVAVPSDSRSREYINNIDEGGAFELPVSGATGYAAVDLPVFESANTFSNFITALNPGQGFTIIREENDWWQIEINNIRGWVMHKYCFINLPDIIPSIIYNNTNTYFSMFKSSGLDIPNITGRALYDAMDFNVRLDREEYIAPVLYAMAGRVFRAQHNALAEGHTLILYEAFRPADAHNELHEYFSELVNTNPAVRAGITADSFNIRWFLAESPYNHQRGTAVDVSLARIDSMETRTSGNYAYIYITGYTEYIMQTDIHELSVAAAVYASTVHARSTTSWIGQPMSSRATPGTVLLHRYCTDAGLIPLASEWWHFNDLVNTEVAIEMNVTGEFFLDRTYSRVPELD